MSEWLEKKVKELCIIGRGRVISQDEISSNPGIYPVFSSQTANNGEMGKIETFDFEGEYVTWTTDGANAGTVFYRSGRFNCTNVCGTLKEKENDSLDLQFFSYLLSTEAKKHVSYIGNPKLMNGVMAEVRLNLPKEKPEQTRIAEILSTADEAIAHTEALIAKYQRIKTGLMQDLLTKGIDENGNIRSKETHKFKESKLGKIPVEWDVVSVGSLCKEIVVGIVIKPTQYYIESGIPMLRSFNIKEGAIEMRDLVYMSNLDNERLSKSKLKEGDVVSVRTGYPGTTAIITKEIEDCNCIDLVISRVNTAILNPNFLVTWINSHLAKRQILNQQSGNAQQHFNVGQMKELLIYKIPLEEQNRILNLVKIEEDKTINSKLHLSKLQSLKTGLMQDLLSGKVRVKI